MEYKITDKQIVIWFNLFIGFYNMYLWNDGGTLFNLIIGILNIGVWVFFRGEK
jgi:hypothetical protein